MSGCAITPDQVNEAFLAAPPLMSQDILDLSIKHPNWLQDIFEVSEWPQGQGTIMQQLIIRGGRPTIERGTGAWKKLGNLSGCDPCEGPKCDYNWTTFGGYGIDRKQTELMSQDFRSPEYCVEEIQTTAHFKEVFGFIVRNLYAQTSYYKEFSIGQNFLTMLAKKFVVDSGGPKINPVNPYVYRNVGNADLAALNIEMLEFFYESMRRIPDVIPYDVVDGAPIYSLMASHQLLARLYRDDTNLRQDVRFSGLANDMLMKYNFMSTIRGMFIAAPILYPRRFNIVNGEPVEVLPMVDEVPAEVGAYTYLNPAYEAATHEEIILNGKHPFKIFQYSTLDTLGGNTSFGPQDSFMNVWKWINPLTKCDPGRKTGYFWTNAKLAISQQFSDGIYGILVARPSVSLTAMWNPVPVCPPAQPECNNEVPDVGCPCPVVLDIQANPLVADNYFVTFATPIEGEVGYPVTLVLDNGLSIEGTLDGLSTNGEVAEITFEGGLAGCTAQAVVGIDCGAPLACSSLVTQTCDCRSNQTDVVELTLEKAIVAGVTDDILVYFGDCTTAMMTITAITPETLTYSVEYATGYGPTDDPTGAGMTNLNADLVCDRGGISKVCVPPAEGNNCPACEVTIDACVEEEV